MQLHTISWPLLLVINTLFHCHISTLLHILLRRGSLNKLPCCFPPDLALKFDYEIKRKLHNSWASAVTIFCHSHWPILLLIIFLSSPICQSICIHWVGIISFYSINSLEQRFLVGFTVRFPKCKKNNNSKESERRPALVHLSYKQKVHCLSSSVYH